MAFRAPLWLLLLAALASACSRGGREEPAAALPDTTGPVVVPLHGLALRAEPSDTARVAFEVAAGNPLRVLEARGGWMRLATWDDRMAWGEEAAVVDLSLWAHFQQALGGAPLSDLRPAYPLADGRWVVEAPPPSPGVVTSGSLWILGVTTAAGNLTGVENLPSACGGGANRVGVLAEAPPREPASGESPGRGRGPHLAQARLATTAAPVATLRGLSPREATPDAGDLEALRRLADSLGAATGARFAAAGWLALGETAGGTVRPALWAALAGEPGPSEPDAPSWAAAAIVVQGEARLVVLPYRAPGAPLALRPVLAFATAGDGRPTIMLVERATEGGTRLEAYVARERDYRRFYVGYAWGC